MIGDYDRGLVRTRITTSRRVINAIDSAEVREDWPAVAELARDLATTLVALADAASRLVEDTK